MAPTTHQSPTKPRSNSFCYESFDQSPISVLASVRILVLAALADIETRIVQVEAELSDDSKAWISDTIDMVRRIREDVKSHLPDLHLLDMPTVENLVRHYQAEFTELRSHLPGLDDVRAHLQDFDQVRSHILEVELPKIRSKLPDFESVRLSLKHHLPTLSDNLQSLNSRLSSVQWRSGLVLPSFASKLLEKVLASDLVSQLLESETAETELKEKKSAKAVVSQIAIALKVSNNGARLITWDDLPSLWRNNEFVKTGYRFIPLENWRALAWSFCQLHNETVNIHTHSIPLILSLALPTFPLLNPHASKQAFADAPDIMFITCAQMCLLTSTLWHIFSGCSHPALVEFFARLDYVGIGWLISASVATVAYYGLSCHRPSVYIYLSACFFSGVAGSILPLMQWFNERKHKKWRILFFLSLAFLGVAPVAHLSIIHSSSAAFSFIAPIVPSLISYIIGLLFYANHFPECCFPKHRRGILTWADWIGGGGHAIWHIFIVLAIRQHRVGMIDMRSGFEGEYCPLL